MFEDKYELKSLYDNKNELIRGKISDNNDGCGDCSTSESAFLGPVLWNDAYTINDLDNINLEDFSPTLLCESSESSQTWDNGPSLNKSRVNESYVSEVSKDFRLGRTNGIDLNSTWSVISNPEPNLIQIPQSRPSVSHKTSQVPLDQKNEKYWNRRMKNNASAKRSRDARRLMEKQVYVKATLLERENAQLRIALNRLAEENKTLRELLSGQSSCAVPQNVIPTKTLVLEACSDESSTLTASSLAVPTPSTAVSSTRLQYRFIQPRCPKI